MYLYYLDFQVNTISTPPEEYGKAGTQRNWRGSNTSGGACGLMRWSAQNLTNFWMRLINQVGQTLCSTNLFVLQVLHDCRQSVSWDVWLNPATGETLTFKLLFISYKVLKEQTVINCRKRRMRSSLCDPYKLGYTFATMEVLQSLTRKKILSYIKSFLSSDWKLQLVFMKPESLVIVNQNVTVNM